MIVVAYRRTMASAKRLIGEKPPTPQRDRVIELSLRWIEQQKQQRLAQSVRPVDQNRKGRQKVAPFLPLDRPVYTSPRVIIEMVAFWHGISESALTGPSRFADIVTARFDAIRAIHHNCRITGRKLRLVEIARYFGNRDHTTILNALSAKRRVTAS